MIQKLRKFGFFTKGFVYIIIGILTFLTALNFGGKISDKNGVISFLENQIFGKVLLLILSLGLMSYALSRAYKFYDVLKNEDSNKKYIAAVNYLFRTFFYGSFAVSIFLKVFNKASSDVTKETLVSRVLKIENGNIILILIGAIFLGSAINQFYKVISNSYLEDIKKSKNIASFNVLKKTGAFGIFARGISFLIFSWFIISAAFYNNPQKIKGTQEMFSFLNSLTFGNILMAIMALGFVCYGVFQYFYGRYSNS
ncbi:DUF1206 domain-containing protein [uncultured Polaribacter sp.]|uniref:DUF1206 domain-containing protein n=1 Tax=uncultured Polaribacter sp. TaxID=174711 RepID=UPI00262566C5|nr:DUF1206 domain-containing protein [uncultured Polaribacter sp.]